MLIGSRRFTIQDQQAFAVLSGDWNPMHMDSASARKLFDGKCVVHGVQVLLQALETWMQHDSSSLAGIRCEFKNPVYVDDMVEFHGESTGVNRYVIRVQVGGLACAKIQCLLGIPASVELPQPSVPLITGGLAPGSSTVPLNLPVADCVGASYAFSLQSLPTTLACPHLYHRLGQTTVSALVSLSWFVGMVCPGLHSLFATLDVSFARTTGGTAQDNLHLSVDQFDERFSLFTIGVSGALSGSITAFRRPEPVAQLSLVDVQSQVAANEFSGSHTLVIGGSRGLGEYTAKVLVAGGGTVTLTYISGESDARQLGDLLNNHRQGSCSIKFYSVLQDPASIFRPDEMQLVSAIYFYATPRIFRKRPRGFIKELFDEFFAVYVTALYRLAEYCEAVCQQPVVIFMPSSIAVTETPDDLVEYAAAKRCGEMLADAINASYRKVSVVVARLPRLETDQTATVVRVRAESIPAVMLPLIRQVSGNSTAT